MHQNNSTSGTVIIHAHLNLFAAYDCWGDHNFRLSILPVTGRSSHSDVIENSTSQLLKETPD
jgi:hypothetical protein